MKKIISASRPALSRSNGRLSGSNDRPEPKIPKIFSLVIHCRDENHQRQIYEQLTAQKIHCRVITL